MFNPTRRNRNTGTERRGYGQNNQLTIPRSSDGKTYLEKIKPIEKREVTINGHPFLFLIEATRAGSIHACSISDVEQIIRQIPSTDYGEMKYIIFRQPKRKEEILSPVWGRLVYAYEYENVIRPAIILESVNYPRKMKWKKSLSVSDQQELERLKKDGHTFIDDGKYLQAELLPENVRNTQLYRTLPHEFGHYVHYLRMVEPPDSDPDDFEQWEKRYDAYHRLPQEEKETFAHRYASELAARLA
ncbi:hypothetical protein ACQKLP_01675 [Chitinophaga sp. NPDC101104]|uniref:hypothetical protein n=1 Tax=Chitinophaga sp. NPDC101104 TaxID=3390561 RepID=UPI003CFCC165